MSQFINGKTKRMLIPRRRSKVEIGPRTRFPLKCTWETKVPNRQKHAMSIGKHESNNTQPSSNHDRHAVVSCRVVQGRGRTRRRPMPWQNDQTTDPGLLVYCSYCSLKWLSLHTTVIRTHITTVVATSLIVIFCVETHADDKTQGGIDYGGSVKECSLRSFAYMGIDAHAVTAKPCSVGCAQGMHRATGGLRLL